jgi:hypothetical protein
MSRRRKALFFFLGLAAVLALVAASIVAKVRRGEDLLWISELWMPAAIFSIGLVVGIEYVIGPGKPTAAPASPAPVPVAVVVAAPAKAAPRRKPVTKAKPKAPAKKTPKN